MLAAQNEQVMTEENGIKAKRSTADAPTGAV
jgi:hypothetical protein